MLRFETHKLLGLRAEGGVYHQAVAEDPHIRADLKFLMVTPDFFYYTSISLLTTWSTPIAVAMLFTKLISWKPTELGATATSQRRFTTS